MTVLERNSDVVMMQCYAPLFAFDGHTQWNPDLIGFDHLASYGSTSYWVQALFAGNVGDKYLPVTASSKDLYCSATLDSKTGKVFIKIVNLADSVRDVALLLAGSKATEATLHVLTGDESGARNGIAEPNRVMPRSAVMRGGAGRFEYAAPARSASVLVF